MVGQFRIIVKTVFLQTIKVNFAIIKISIFVILSSMNYLGGKPHSFNAMVNARVIAMTYASKKEKNF